MSTTSRRTVLAAAAWTAPAVIVASSAPAYASSNVDPDPDPEPSVCVAGIVQPGRKGKKHTLQVLASTIPVDGVYAVTIGGLSARHKHGVWEVSTSRKTIEADLWVHYKKRVGKHTKTYTWKGCVTFVWPTAPTKTPKPTKPGRPGKPGGGKR